MQCIISAHVVYKIGNRPVELQFSRIYLGRATCYMWHNFNEFVFCVTLHLWLIFVFPVLIFLSVFAYSWRFNPSPPPLSPLLTVSELFRKGLDIFMATCLLRRLTAVSAMPAVPLVFAARPRLYQKLITNAIPHVRSRGSYGVSTTFRKSSYPTVVTFHLVRYGTFLIL